MRWQENIGFNLWLSGKVLIAAVAFALVGGVTGSLAWALTAGDNDVARAIFQPALRGDYMIRSDNLTGEEPLYFWGRDPQKREAYW